MRDKAVHAWITNPSGELACVNLTKAFHRYIFLSHLVSISSLAPAEGNVKKFLKYAYLHLHAAISELPFDTNVVRTWIDFTTPKYSIAVINVLVIKIERDLRGRYHESSAL